MKASPKPKISIIIPVYNGSNYLKEAIDSALAQTYKNIEIIVVNDGSNDEGATEKIALSYGKKIKYYKKENGGVATALNLGIKKMTGEYFSWLSHDDLYEKSKIYDEVALLPTYQSTDIIVVCGTKTLFSNGIKKKEHIDGETFKYFDIFLATSAMVGVNGCSLLIPRKALLESGGFNVNLPVTQDYDLWFRLKDKYQFILLDKHLVISRRHSQQDSVQKQILMLSAGDQLHSSFLETIDYKRFEEYFKANKSNVKHTLVNYVVYRSRGYKKTAALIFKNILTYYYENHPKKFYDVFNSEIGLVTGMKLTGSPEGTELRLCKSSVETKTNFQDIIHECDNFFFSMTYDRSSNDNTNPAMSNNFTKRLTESIKQDGIYLTVEKVLRKVYLRAKNRTK